VAYFTYDTSVVIAKRLVDFRKPKGLLLSSVVLLELIASAQDESQRKIYEELTAADCANWLPELLSEWPLIKASDFFR
jgi:hypothetical protein